MYGWWCYGWWCHRSRQHFLYLLGKHERQHYEEAKLLLTAPPRNDISR